MSVVPESRTTEAGRDFVREVVAEEPLEMEREVRAILNWA